MKRLSIYPVFLLLVCTVLNAQDYTNPAVTSPTVPQSGGRSLTTPPTSGRSVTTPPTSYGRHTVPSRVNESDFWIRNRIFGNYDGSVLYGGDSLFTTPPYDSGGINQLYTPLSDFMRRSTSTLYGYRSTRQTQSYFIPPQTSAFVNRDQPVYSIPSRDYRTGLNTATALEQTPVTQDTLDRDYFTTFPTRRPLSSSPSRIQDYVEQTLQEELEEVDPDLTETMEESDYTHILEDYVVKPDEPITPDENTDLLDDKVEPVLEEKTPIEQDQSDQQADPLLALEQELQKELEIESQTRTDSQTQMEEDPGAVESVTRPGQGDTDTREQQPQRPPVSHKQAEQIREGRSFEEHMEYKFKQYIRAGREYLKSQRYYKAADAFIVADFYKADQAEALLGRSHALFAAGEYMSSAYFLQKAIHVDAKKALEQVDLVELIGSRDTYDNRIVDLANWTNRTRAPELAMLSAYVLYTSNKLDSAKEAITIAGEKMQDDPEYRKLRQVIEDEIAASPF